MEFVQYHPTGLPGTGILITEASRGEGGLLKNSEGDRFLVSYDYGVGNKAELGPRDMISRAVVQEIEAGRGHSAGPTANTFTSTSRTSGKRKTRSAAALRARTRAHLRWAWIP